MFFCSLTLAITAQPHTALALACFVCVVCWYHSNLNRICSGFFGAHKQNGKKNWHGLLWAWEEKERKEKKNKFANKSGWLYKKCCTQNAPNVCIQPWCVSWCFCAVVVVVFFVVAYVKFAMTFQRSIVSIYRIDRFRPIDTHTVAWSKNNCSISLLLPNNNNKNNTTTTVSNIKSDMADCGDVWCYGDWGRKRCFHCDNHFIG